MYLFVHIIETTMLPIFLMIAIGTVLDKKFTLDLRTLSKLNFYILLPAFIFKALYTSKLGHESLELFLGAFSIMIANGIMASLVSKAMGYDLRRTQIIKNATMFNNGGNIGIAVATLVFTNDPYIVHGATPFLSIGILAIIAALVIQNISCNTLGFYQAGIGSMTKLDAIKVVFHMPTVYTVPCALIFHFFVPFDLRSLPVWPALSIVAAAFVPMAMITLGVQINRSSWNFFHRDVMITTAMRLIGGPLIAAAIMWLATKYYAPLHPISAQAIIIVYSVPSALNTALMAFEMKNNPELATQIVMATTIFSAVTMPIAIIFAYYMFPFT